MNEKKLQQYAELLVKIGLRIEKKEEIWLGGGVENAKFVNVIVEECYKAGAKTVHVNWYCDETSRLEYQYESLSTLSKVPSYVLAKYKYRCKKLPATLWLDDADPDALAGLDHDKIAKADMKTWPKFKPYVDKMNGKYKWCIAAVPGKKWAKKVFPDLSVEEAIEKLWEAIFDTCRVDETGTIENWNKHNAYLEEKRTKLTSYNFRYLKYHSDMSGTDFKVELIPNMTWGAGVDLTDKGKPYNPNLPTEEVYTTPLAGSCEGLLVATKPLSYEGDMIEEFSIRFENGRAVEVKAKKGQDLLERMIKMDEFANMLGECALVPWSSPINKSGILFYNTLFDENAVCHFALGMGFKELLPGGASLSVEQAKEKGVNDSMIHVDFMVGTPDLHVVGIKDNGEEVVIFNNGTWAI